MQKENENQQPRLEEEGLNEAQFAIKENAKFKPVKGKQLTINEDGTVTITYRIVKPTDLVVGPKTKVDFTAYAVFERGASNHFKDGTLEDLTLETTSGKDVMLNTSNQDISVVTTGKKRESGSGLVTATKQS